MNTVEKNHPGERILKLIIDNKEYEQNSQFITGAQIRELELIPAEVEIYLHIKEPWKDELIKDTDRVDLARPGIEFFYHKKKLRFTIDGNPFEWKEQYITGAEIRQLGQIKPDFEIFLEIHGPWHDELVKDSDRIDLARPGAENFYGCKPNTANG